MKLFKLSVFSNEGGKESERMEKIKHFSNSFDCNIVIYWVLQDIRCRYIFICRNRCKVKSVGCVWSNGNTIGRRKNKNNKSGHKKYKWYGIKIERIKMIATSTACWKKYENERVSERAREVVEYFMWWCTLVTFTLQHHRLHAYIQWRPQKNQTKQFYCESRKKCYRNLRPYAFICVFVFVYLALCETAAIEIEYVSIRSISKVCECEYIRWHITSKFYHIE